MSDATPAAGTGCGDDDVDLRVAIVQANDGGERSQSGISWVVDHLAAILVAAGIVLSTAIGVAYEFFYGKLGVRSSELGLGTEQILLHGALGVGFVGTFVAIPLAILVVLALNNWGQPSSSATATAPDPARMDAAPDPPSVAAVTSARQRINVLLGLVFLSALAAFVLFVSDAPLYGVFGVGLAVVASLWLGRVGVEATPERWRAVWEIAIVRYASLLSVIGGAVLLTGTVIEGDDASPFGAVAGGIAIPLGVLGWRESRGWAVASPQTGTHRRLLSVRADVVAGVVAMAWLVAYVALITSGAATLVRKGGQPPIFSSPALYSAPIHCVRVHWIEPPAPADLPEHALYLGQADETTVLYQAQTSPAGALRLPSARLALTPAAAARCRRPPSN